MKKLILIVLLTASSTFGATTNVILSSNATYALIVALNTNGGFATNAPWPKAGTNTTASTNGLTVTVNADVSHVEVSDASNAVRQATILRDTGNGTNTVFWGVGNTAYMSYTNDTLFYPGWPALWFKDTTTNYHRASIIFDNAGFNSGCEFLWNPYHSGGGEMQITSGAFAIAPGYDSGPLAWKANRRIQIGGGAWHHGWMEFISDWEASAVDPLAPSLPLLMDPHWWDGAQAITARLGFKAEAYDTVGNYGWTFYPYYNPDMSGTNIIGGTPSIRLNGTNWPGITVVSGSVISPTFGSFTNSWTTNTAIPYRTNLILLSSANTGCGFTGITGFPTNVESYAQLTIKASGDIVFTNPVSVWTSDGLTNRTITNGTSMVIAVDYIPGVITQAALVRFSHP